MAEQTTLGDIVTELRAIRGLLEQQKATTEMEDK